MWLASAVLAVLVGAAFTALIVAVSAQREATEREARSKDVTAASLQLEKLVSDVESGFLGFTVTGPESSLEPYERRARRWAHGWAGCSPRRRRPRPAGPAQVLVTLIR